MRFELSYDSEGKPNYVTIYHSGMIESRNFDPARDGWMLDQLNPKDFPAITIGRDTEDLVAMVNLLSKENWELKRRLNTYNK